MSGVRGCWVTTGSENWDIYLGDFLSESRAGKDPFSLGKLLSRSVGSMPSLPPQVSEELAVVSWREFISQESVVQI